MGYYGIMRFPDPAESTVSLKRCRRRLWIPRTDGRHYYTAKNRRHAHARDADDLNSALPGRSGEKPFYSRSVFAAAAQACPHNNKTRIMLLSQYYYYHYYNGSSVLKKKKIHILSFVILFMCYSNSSSSAATSAVTCQLKFYH